MYGHSVFAQDEASFYKRLHFIATYKNNFPQLIEEIGKAKKKPANSLNEKDVQLLDILAFFDGIELYLYPMEHKDYFPGQRYINQSDIKEIFNLAKPVSLEQEEIELLLDKNYAFSEKTLTQFFKDLGS